MFAVMIHQNTGETEVLTFDQPEISVGRSKANDIVLRKGNVSKIHCRILQKNGHFVVLDLKSTNGTFVNDARVGRASLMNGDRLRLGRIEFEVSTN